MGGCAGCDSIERRGIAVRGEECTAGHLAAEEEKLQLVRVVGAAADRAEELDARVGACGGPGGPRGPQSPQQELAESLDSYVQRCAQTAGTRLRVTAPPGRPGRSRRRYVRARWLTGCPGGLGVGHQLPDSSLNEVAHALSETKE